MKVTRKKKCTDQIELKKDIKTKGTGNPIYFWIMQGTGKSLAVTPVYLGKKNQRRTKK